MQEDDDVKSHIAKFFDVVNKSAAMDIDINVELLAIMSLYSLPGSYDNFIYAIESGVQLPSPDELTVKILEVPESRKQTNSGTPYAIVARKSSYCCSYLNGKEKLMERSFLCALNTTHLDIKLQSAMEEKPMRKGS